MIHLFGKYYMIADNNCYTVGERAERAQNRSLKPRAKYYPTIARAVSDTAEIVLRDKIASGEIMTLKVAVEEFRSIKDEILNNIKNETEG